MLRPESQRGGLVLWVRARALGVILFEMKGSADYERGVPSVLRLDSRSEEMRLLEMEFGWAVRGLTFYQMLIMGVETRCAVIRECQLTEQMELNSTTELL